MKRTFTYLLLVVSTLLLSLPSAYAEAYGYAPATHCRTYVSRPSSSSSASRQSSSFVGSPLVHGTSLPSVSWASSSSSSVRTSSVSRPYVVRTSSPSASRSASGQVMSFRSSSSVSKSYGTTTQWAGLVMESVSGSSAPAPVAFASVNNVVGMGRRLLSASAYSSSVYDVAAALSSSDMLRESRPGATGDEESTQRPTLEPVGDVPFLLMLLLAALFAFFRHRSV